MKGNDPARWQEVPRYFGVVVEIDGDASVVAWGHEVAGQAVTSWRLANGEVEVAVFASAEAALDVAESLYPARLIWLRTSLPPAEQWLEVGEWPDPVADSCR